MVTPANARSDGNIYKVGPHTAYITDDTWEGNWESAVSVSRDRYIIEMSIPWNDLGGKPEPGHTFKLGFIRHRNETVREISRFNWYSGENIRPQSFDPADFIQEHPIIFAPVTFEDNRAILTRYIEISDPWEVKRSETAYENVLTNRKVDQRAAHFYLGISGFLLPDSIRNRYDKNTWAMEEDNFITELGRAGAYGPFLPGFLNQKGEAALDSLYKQYGMKFGFHGSISSQKADEAGAKMMRPRGTAAFFDPVYVKLKNEMLEGWLKKYGRKPWLFDVRGQDEPFNQIATLRMPGTWEMVNAELKRNMALTWVFRSVFPIRPTRINKSIPTADLFPIIIPQCHELLHSGGSTNDFTRLPAENIISLRNMRQMLYIRHITETRLPTLIFLTSRFYTMLPIITLPIRTPLFAYMFMVRHGVDTISVLPGKWSPTLP